MTLTFYKSMGLLCLYASGITTNQWDEFSRTIHCVAFDLRYVLIKQTSVNFLPSLTSTFPKPSNFVSVPGPSVLLSSPRDNHYLDFCVYHWILYQQTCQNYITNERSRLPSNHLTLLKIFLVVSYRITLAASVIFLQRFNFEKQSKALAILVIIY